MVTQTQMYSMVHHSMSLEDPEQGTPADDAVVSENFDALLAEAREGMEDFEVVEVRNVGDATHVLGAFEEGGELMTYYVIEPVRSM